MYMFAGTKARWAVTLWKLAALLSSFASVTAPKVRQNTVDGLSQHVNRGGPDTDARFPASHRILLHPPKGKS